MKPGKPERLTERAFDRAILSYDYAIGHDRARIGHRSSEKLQEAELGKRRFLAEALIWP
jgi:hypothetical protein